MKPQHWLTVERLRLGLAALALCLPPATAMASAEDRWPENAAAGDELPAPGPDNAPYMQQAWPKTRLLVWARPGRKATGKPSDWLENGRPATAPPDKNTDLLIPGPEGDAPPRRCDIGDRVACRHLTVAPNAAVFVHTLTCSGNIWLRGRCMMISCNLTGDRHTFLRNDGPQARFTVYYTQSKPEAGVELIGHFETQDEVRIFDGDLILAPDCRFEPGRNSTPTVASAARLILLDGAYFGKWLNDMHSLDMVLDGAIQGGAPRRPLARDCTLALSFQNWSQTDLGQTSEFAGDDRRSALYRKLLARKPAMVANRGATLRTWRKPGADANLVIRWHGLKLGEWRGSNSGYLDLTKTLAALSKKYKRTIAPKITVYFDADTTIDGVRFDDLHAGGILFKDIDTRQKWRDISFGDNCMGAPQRLFQHLPDGLTSKKPTY